MRLKIERLGILKMAERQEGVGVTQMQKVKGLTQKMWLWVTGLENGSDRGSSCLAAQPLANLVLGVPCAMILGVRLGLVSWWTRVIHQLRWVGGQSLRGVHVHGLDPLLRPCPYS